MDKITTLDTQNPVELRDVINDTMGQFVPAHIVGATFSAAWLSETEGGSSLTPEAGRLYTVVTAGEYYNQLFRWNEAAYVQVGGGELPEDLPVTAHTSAITTAGVTPVAELQFLPTDAGILEGTTVYGNFAKYLDYDTYPAGTFRHRFTSSASVYSFNNGDEMSGGFRRLTYKDVINHESNYRYVQIYADRIYYYASYRDRNTTIQIYNLNDGGQYKYTIPSANVTANSYCELIADDTGYVKAQNVRPFFDIADGGIVITVDNAALTTPITGTLKIFETSAPQSVGAIVNYDNYRIERLETETTSLDGRVTDLEAIDIPVDLPVTSAAVVSGTLPTTGWSVAGWQASTLPSTAIWNPVTYGNGKFVAVAFNSTSAAYSLDGINWSASTMPSSQYWRSVTYGSGKFVAVASGTSAAAYSLDGINWSLSTLPTSSDWRSVTYGNGNFVAVGSSVTAYSLDGITWTESIMPSSSNWRSVTYGNGKFVAVAYDTTAAAYSLDGITWTESTMPSSQYWQSVTYGDGKFVAVAYDTTAAAYSLDGINWFTSTLPSSQQWYSVTYGNGKFVAVSGSGTVAAYWIAADLYNYTITDATVKATSDVLLELTDAHAIKAQALEAGKITVQRGTIPQAAIPYTYKVVQTSSAGQFTLVNHFVPTYAEYSVSDYEVTVGDSSSIVYIKLAEAPVRSDRYYAFIKGDVRLKDGEIEYAYFVNGSVDLDEAPTAVATYSQATITPNLRMCLYYPEVPEFRVGTPNLNISVPAVKSQTLKLCVINF